MHFQTHFFFAIFLLNCSPAWSNLIADRCCVPASAGASSAAHSFDGNSTLTHEMQLSRFDITSDFGTGAMLLALQKHVPFQM